jgi:acetyl-CoA carboxylase alpha subunit
MGIQVSGAEVQPQVRFDKIFVSQLKVTQAMSTNEALPPVYEVAIEYRNYGVDVHQQRHYHSDTQEILVSDFLKLAKSKYAEGDTTLVVALQAIETAIAALIKHDMGIDAKVV